MNSCLERDNKRKQLEAKKSTITAPPSNFKTKTASNTSKKPISYEDLMKRAEENSKNILSISDLKKDTVNEDLKRAEFVRKSSANVNAPIKRIPSKTANPANTSASQKKPVKVIKRDMHPRHEVVSDLVVLNQKKRDLRSIEQIQKELKQEAKKSTNLQSKTHEGSEEYFAANYSSIISDIFGYDRNKYAGQDEEDLSDMEADYETVLAEEARCARIAKKEDLEEELKEIERKKKKANLFKNKK